MRVVLLGNKRAPYCSEVYYKQELESLGVEVIFLQETEVNAKQILAFTKEANALFWVHTHGWDTPGMDNVLTELRKLKIPSFAYHLDLYLPLPERWLKYKDSTYFKGLDYFFTVDKLMTDWLNQNTNTKGVFLPSGVFSEECTALEPQEVSYEIVFVGSKNYHSEWPYRPKLIDWLRKTYGTKFLHVGRDGDTGIVRGMELNQIYSNSKIAVGDSFNINFNYPYYSSDRLWESIGRNAFTIYPEITGLTSYFINEKEVVYYKHGDFNDLKIKIDYYLDHPEDREQIRRAGHERCKKEGTYRERLKDILKVVFSA